MKIYIDTEFTDLVPYNKLISIALVDENEEYFYAELTDTYTLEECSPFVKDHVLPYLRGGVYRMNEYDCKLRLSAWIESRSGECVIHTDAPGWDLPHLLSMMPPPLPENLVDGYIHISVPTETTEKLIKQYSYDAHNALDDALVMKKAFDK